MLRNKPEKRDDLIALLRMDPEREVLERYIDLDLEEELDEDWSDTTSSEDEGDEDPSYLYEP